MSKVQSHEMKETLYSNLVQADLVRAFIQRHILTTWWHLVNVNQPFLCHQEEQQRLRKTIAEADEMLQSLDDCVCELEAGI